MPLNTPYDVVKYGPCIHVIDRIQVDYGMNK